MSMQSRSSPADTEDNLFGPAWRSAFGAALGLTVGPSVLLIMVFGIFLPTLRAEFGWSLAQGAIGSAIMSVTIVLTSPLQGFLCDRLGARLMILLSALPFGAGVFAMSAMPGSLWVFYAACATLPLLGLGLWPVTYNKAAAGWFDRRLGLAMGVVATGIGAMIAAPLVANLIVDYGWRKTYQALGLTSVAITLVTAVLLVRNAPATTMAHTNTAGDSFAEALRSSGYRKLLVAFALLGAVSSAVLVHQATLLLEAGHSMREVGVLQGTVGAAAIVGRLGVGWLLDRVSIRWIMPPVLLAASAGCAVLGANATGIFVPISAATLGLMLGAEMDVLGYMIRRNHGSRSFGALYGLVFAIFSLGSGLGAAAVGRLHDVYDGYNIPFLGLALILVVVAAIFTNASFARRPS